MFTKTLHVYVYSSFIYNYRSHQDVLWQVNEYINCGPFH